MENEWRDIPGYEGSYKLSREGQIKSLKRYAGNRMHKEKLLKLGKDTRGNAVVNLSKNGHKQRFVIKHLVERVYG